VPDEEKEEEREREGGRRKVNDKVEWTRKD